MLYGKWYPVCSMISGTRKSITSVDIVLISHDNIAIFGLHFCSPFISLSISLYLHKNHIAVASIMFCVQNVALIIDRLQIIHSDADRWWNTIASYPKRVRTRASLWPPCRCWVRSTRCPYSQRTTLVAAAMRNWRWCNVDDVMSMM